MLGDIQALLDGVAAELGVGVALSDVDDRVLAHTAHHGEIDEVRQEGILHRRTPREVLAWFERWGIREALGPVHTPSDRELGVLARWILPVRLRGIHLGYVWVLDADGITEEDIAPVVELTDQIAALLYRRRLASRLDEDLLRLLLIPNLEADALATEVRALGTFTHRGPIRVVVTASSDHSDLESPALSDLALALQRMSDQAVHGALLAGVLSGQGVILAPLRDEGDRASAERVAEKVCQLALHANDELSLVVAIGGSADVERASTSYAQAQRVLRMMRAVPDLGPIAAWDDLGVFRAIALLPQDELQRGVIDERVCGLLEDESLLTTAEAFLDRAGNVQATAASLFLHRTTLYQRLDRIEETFGLDLRRNGDHRLITHLGLKLARATGR